MDCSWRSHTSPPTSPLKHWRWVSFIMSSLSSSLVWGALIRPDPHISCWGLSFIHSLGLLGTVHCTYWRPPLPRGPHQTELNKIQSYFSHRKMKPCFVYQGWINEILTNECVVEDDSVLDLVLFCCCDSFLSVLLPFSNSWITPGVLLLYSADTPSGEANTVMPQ